MSKVAEMTEKIRKFGSLHYRQTELSLSEQKQLD